MNKTKNQISDGNRTGAFIALLFGFCQISNDVAMKAVLVDMPIFQSLFIRGLMLTPLLLVLLYWRGELSVRPQGRDRFIISLRILCEIGLSYCLLKAIMTMPIANVVIITQAVPFGLAISAMLFFGETVDWRRWLAIIGGFFGVMLVVRPGTQGFDVNSLYALASVLLFVIRDIFTRRLSSQIPAFYAAFWQVVGVTLFAIIMSFYEEWAVPEARHYGLIFTAGVFIFLTNLFAVVMMRLGDIGFVAIFRYGAILYAILFGYLFFAEVPDALALLGALVIVIAGAFSLYHDRQHKHRQPS